MNKYPLQEIEAMNKGNRRIGLGLMGFADTLIKLGTPYNSDDAVNFANELMGFVNVIADNYSKELGRERGEYPNRELESHAQRRNAATTTIAPTGTISMIAGCSSGIEPLFAIAYVKNVMDNTPLVYVEPEFERIAKERGFYSEALMAKIAEQGSLHGIEEVPEDVRNIFVTSHEISPEWHIKIQAAFQAHVENSVSKTINMPNSATVDDVRDAYLQAFESGCKGITVYRDGCKDTQVLYTGTKDPNKKDTPKEIVIPVEAIKPRKRDSVLRGNTHRQETGCGHMYVTVNMDEQGLTEVFSQMGKTGGCASAQSEAVTRLASLALRAGVEPHEVTEQLSGIRCPNPAWQKGGQVLSCPDGIAQVLTEYLPENIKAENIGMAGVCPDCSGPLAFEEGCVACHSCGFSKCG